MKDLKDEIRYGFSLYPFAILIAAGVFISGTGPAVLQSLLSGLNSIPMYRAILLTGMLAVQALGAVVTAAGLFGALYRIIQDAKE